VNKRIILDTNVLVSAFSSAEGSSRIVLREIFKGRWQPLISLALFAEYEDVLSRPHIIQRCILSEVEQHDLLNAYLSQCVMVEMYFAWRPNLKDEGDNHVFELAVAAQNATLLTWNVRDFANAELRFPHIQIQTPAQWLKENL
jgi:putative PIN family toxin of toxin-antitoxin system